MNHEGENMDVLSEQEIRQIFRASRKRRNENAEGDRKREEAKKKYLSYFKNIFAGSASGKTSEQKP